MELVLGSRKESHWVLPMVTNSVRSMAPKKELRLVQPKELYLALQMGKNCNNKEKIRLGDQGLEQNLQTYQD
jgi:hypothetical protein